MFEYWQGFLSADTRSVIDRGEIVETARIKKGGGAQITRRKSNYLCASVLTPLNPLASRAS